MTFAATYVRKRRPAGAILQLRTRYRSRLAVAIIVKVKNDSLSFFDPRDFAGFVSIAVISSQIWGFFFHLDHAYVATRVCDRDSVEEIFNFRVKWRLIAQVISVKICKKRTNVISDLIWPDLLTITSPHYRSFELRRLLWHPLNVTLARAW